MDKSTLHSSIVSLVSVWAAPVKYCVARLLGECSGCSCQVLRRFVSLVSVCAAPVSLLYLFLNSRGLKWDVGVRIIIGKSNEDIATCHSCNCRKWPTKSYSATSTWCWLETGLRSWLMQRRTLAIGVVSFGAFA